MIIKFKKTSMKMSIVAAVFLFACNSSSRPSTLADIQLKHTSSVATADTVTEISEDNTKNADADSIPRNTKNADADDNPKYSYWDEYGQLRAMDYRDMNVKPLFNGKDGLEELKKYLNESNKFDEIAEENNIQETIYCFDFYIDTVGFIVDVKIHKGTHQAFGNELVRLLNAMHKHGKWTPGKYDGKILSTRMIICGGFTAKQ